jgi:hypothetical protein
MQWLVDSYTLQAADVAAAYAGRGYNVRTGRWETVSGVNMTPTDIRGHRVKSLDLTIHDAVSTGIKNGVWVIVFVVGDPTHTGYVVPLHQGITSTGRLFQWAGDQEMLGGIFWRIHQGGLAAGDRVDLGVGYV